MTEPTSDPRFIRVTLTSMAGPLIWALHFGALYGGQHVACSAGDLGNTPIRIGIVAATGVALLAMLLVFLNVRRLARPAAPFDEDVPPFLKSVAIFLLGLSLFAILASALAGFMLPACPSLR